MGVAHKRPAALAPAWRSGGSAACPRLGTPLAPNKKGTKKATQLRGKSGSGLLAVRKRVQKKPAAVPYVPAHQQKGEGKMRPGLSWRAILSPWQ
jgi:hypothetical protein